MLGVELEPRKSVSFQRWLPHSGETKPFLGNLQPEEPGHVALCHPCLRYIWSTTLDFYIWWATLDYIWWTTLEDYTGLPLVDFIRGLHWTSFHGLHWTALKCIHFHITGTALQLGWLHCSEMSGHYWTVSHGLRISVGSGRRAREGIWWRKRGPGAGEAFSGGKLCGEISFQLNLEFI